MFSVKTKRIIWLVFSILSVGIVADRIVSLVDGTSDWMQLLTAVIIFGLCVRNFFCYRRQEHQGADLE